MTPKEEKTAIKTEEIPQKMEDLLKSSQFRPIPKPGDIIEGKVISASGKEVHLDIDGLTTGVIRGRELHDESGEYSNLKPGDLITATILDLENENGEMELSFQRASHKKAWDNLVQLKNNGEVVAVKVTGANKGGLLVTLGQTAGFLPVSQLTTEHYPRVDGGDRNKILEKLNKLVNQSLNVKVIDVDEKEKKLILSEKAAWEEKQQTNIAKHKVGDVVEGKITGVVNFGAFVEFGEGLEGLIHISELAWQRIDDPKDIVKIGDVVKAEIISIDNSKISLSMKKLMEDPWQKAMEKYKIGQQVKGKVLKINPFGLFVELDQDIHGLAHVSELSSKPIVNPHQIAKVGEEREFKIVSIEPKDHRMGLSIKALDEVDNEKPAVLNEKECQAKA